MHRIVETYRRVEARTLAFLQREHRSILKAVLGLVFVWFGSLKLLRASPVEELVAATAPWFDPVWFFPLLGAIEMIIGLGLIVDRGLRVILALFLSQMMGTFLVLVMLPEVAFVGNNPLRLTVEGEFVVKNLVLVAAGLSIAAGLQTHQPGAAME